MMPLRRALTLLAHKQPQNFSNLLKESPSQVVRSVPALLSSKNNLYERWLQTRTNSSTPASQDEGNQAVNGLQLVSDSASIPSQTEDSAVKHTATSRLKMSARHDLAMIFTCKICETRSVKTVCRESYEKGVVVARCGGCDNLHLMADHLGWFGEPGSVEDFLAAEEIKKGSVDTLNLTLDDLAGKGVLKG